MKILPVVCTLTPATIETRRANLLPGLFNRAQSHEWRSNGVRLLFDLSTVGLVDIAGTIDAERRCCRFLQFDLSVEPDDGPASLTITGPDNTRTFLEALLTA
jgi:hypothetical protein